ncbi:hypothetical protein SAMN05444278_1044 [Psychroflexus salarius]|uniref:Uncharacterized protein n=1 Tax=Psychroflexus salarius TaxID=1155689 RepID=A0A1M4VDI8_9FLAO|nr:hypothetical protein SAMN05444278_1044 [Psychroflexus salarius]
MIYYLISIFVLAFCRLYYIGYKDKDRALLSMNHPSQKDDGKQKLS